ncbi:MAG: hypothetical protein ACRC2T_02725 [Thermoguttaceae bacterium]
MNILKLADGVLSLQSFNEKYAHLLIDSVRVQFPNLKIPKKESPVSIDWQYLIQCASLLSFSEKGKCEDIALRIAQHCLEAGCGKVSPEMTDAACIILYHRPPETAVY